MIIFRMLDEMRFLETSGQACLKQWVSLENTVTYEVFFCRHDFWTWRRCERLLRILGGMSCRIRFEWVGNKNRIAQCISVPDGRGDALEVALKSEFPGIRLGVCETDWNCSQWWEISAGREAVYGVSTCPDKLGSTPFTGFLEALSQMSGLGVFRCEFEPITQDGEARLELARQWDFAYIGRQRFGLQPPSAQLYNVSRELERKLDSNSPLFSVSLGLGAEGDVSLDNLSLFLGLVRCDGRRLVPRRVDVLQPQFLFNARELSVWAHPIPARTVIDRMLPISITDGLDVPTQTDGVTLGKSVDGCAVVLPESVRSKAVHVVGTSGCGKSTLLIQLFLQDVANGVGATFIDPHGDAIEQILQRLPSSVVSNVKLFSIGAEVPCWNPLASVADEGLLVDDVLSALARVSRDWGDRLEHVLRNGLLGLLAIHEATLFNLYQLTRQGSIESERLRRRIIRSDCSPLVKQFWERDFLKDYRKTDLSSTRHKLARLFSGSLLQMFSQRKNAYDAREIINAGSVLLIDLSGLGDSSRRVIGSLWLMCLLQASMSGNRTPHSVFVDECHLFAESGAYETIIAQARKFGLRLCLAHQYLRQFSYGQIDALATAGATIIGRVDGHDASYLAKDLQGRATGDQLHTLPSYSFIGRWDQCVSGFTGQDLKEGKSQSPISVITSDEEIPILEERGFYYDEF